MSSVIDKDLFGHPVMMTGAAPNRPRPMPLNLIFPVSPESDGPTLRFQLWRNGAGKDMVDVTDGLTGKEAIGTRWAAWLKRTYSGPHKAKRIARDLNVQVRTAEGYLAGQIPYAPVFVTAAQVHGPAVLFEVLAPNLVPPTQAESQRAINELKDKLDALGDQICFLTIGS